MIQLDNLVLSKTQRESLDMVFWQHIERIENIMLASYPRGKCSESDPRGKCSLDEGDESV